MSTPISHLKPAEHAAERPAADQTAQQRGPVPVQYVLTQATALSVAAITLAFGFLGKANCIGGLRQPDGSVFLNWGGGRHFATACYSDIVPLYAGRGLDRPGFVYAYSWTEGDLTRYMEYPVLGGLFQGLMGFIARTTYPLIDAANRSLGTLIPDAGWYFFLTAVVLAAMWLAVVAIAYGFLWRRPARILLVAASPLVAVHAFTNWDIPSILFAVGAMWAVSRNRPWLAGLLIGMGTAFKLWPLYLLGAYLVLAIRSRQWVPFAKMCGAAIATLVVLNVPLALAYPKAWGEFLRLNSERSWEWTTLYAVANRELGWQGFDGGATPPSTLNMFSFLAFAGCCLLIAVVGVMARRRPQVAELTFLIVAAFLLTNKVWSPQYSLWLIIPAVLAVPSWKLVASWMAIDALVWPFLFWHLYGIVGGNEEIVSQGLMDVVIVTRIGLIIVMAIVVVVNILRRRAEPDGEGGVAKDGVARAHLAEDDLAGPFNAAAPVR